jgi:hypothetical protein
LCEQRAGKFGVTGLVGLVSLFLLTRLLQLNLVIIIRLRIFTSFFVSAIFFAVLLETDRCRSCLVFIFVVAIALFLVLLVCAVVDAKILIQLFNHFCDVF